MHMQPLDDLQAPIDPKEGDSRSKRFQLILECGFTTKLHHRNSRHSRAEEKRKSARIYYTHIQHMDITSL